MARSFVWAGHQALVHQLGEFEFGQDEFSQKSLAVFHLSGS
jgi:hypothetical protein